MSYPKWIRGKCYLCNITVIASHEHLVPLPVLPPLKHPNGEALEAVDTLLCELCAAELSELKAGAQAVNAPGGAS